MPREGIVIQELIRRIRTWFDAAEETGETSEVIPSAPLSPVYSSALDMFLRIRKDRLTRLADYRVMDEQCPEICQALNIYADNATGGDGDGGTFELEITEGKTPQIEEAIKDIDSETGIKDQLWGIARALVQFGEVFAEPIISERVGNTGGLVRLKPLPVQTMWLNLDEFGKCKDPEKYYIQRNESDREIATWPEHQIVHWKIEGDLDHPHGRSLLHPARPVFRKIHIADNALVIARARRANMRYVYKFDLPGMSVKDRQATVEDIKKRHTTRKFIDRDTGQIRSEETPMRVEDDIFISKNDEVDALQGDTNVTNIADIEHLYNQLFTAIGVPKSFLNREQDLNSKATLTELRIQFSRNVRRVQKALATGLKKFYQIGLLSRGITDDAVARLQFEVKFPGVTATDELIEWQTKQAKVETYEGLSRLRMLTAEDLDDLNRVRDQVDAGLKKIEKADHQRFLAAAKPAEPAIPQIPLPRTVPEFGRPKLPTEMEALIARVSENPEEMDLLEDLKLMIDDNLAAVQRRAASKPKPLPRALNSKAKGR